AACPPMRLNQPRIARWRALGGRVEHGCTAHPLLVFSVQLRPARSILSNALNFLRSAIAAFPLARRAAAALCAARTAGVIATVDDQSLYSSMLATAALRAPAHWLESFR